MSLLPKKRIAVFYDDKGEYLGKKGFSKWDSLIKTKTKTYNVLKDKASITKIKSIWRDKEYTHYNVNNPNPFLFDKKGEPILDAEVYNVQLETKVMRDLNNLSKEGFKITPLMIIIGVVVVGIAIYLLTGHSVTGAPVK
jgi:hypothetical protein